MAGAASQSLRSVMSQLGMVPQGIQESVRKKAIQRAQDRLDPAKIRNKPASLIRQEVRQATELFVDAELPMLPKPERDQLVESVLTEAMGFGVLEEFFRDERIREFLVLAPQQILIKQGELWLPANTHFRDVEHYRSVLLRIYEHGESVIPQTPKPTEPSGFHVRLPNGFRVLAVMPPKILELPPMVTFTRDIAAAGKSGVISQPGSRLVPTQQLTRPEPRPSVAPGTVEFIQPPPSLSGSMGSSHTRRAVDPLERAKQRITEKIISRLASVGTSDLNRVPLQELQRVIALYVNEFSESEGLGLSPADEQRLTREILTAIRRT